ATVILRGKSVFLTPRHHPLAPPKGTRLVALAHVEVDRHEPPIVSDAQARDLAATLAYLRGFMSTRLASRLDRNLGKGSRTVDLFRRELVAGYLDVVVDEVDAVFHAIG